MSLIEQAAKRLEQLRQAGVELPDDPSTNSQAKTIQASISPDATPLAIPPPLHLQLKLKYLRRRLYPLNE